MTYREAIDWLFSTQLFGIKLGLEGPQRLLKEFLAYPRFSTKVIHVAGTNGKGSTCAMIDSIARNSAVRTGLFTSPHLIDFRERIKVSNCEISEQRAAELITDVRELVKDWETHPTFFELTLAVAMRYFKEQDCELIVLETGMGGRLDATTAVPADVAVITPIDLDHTQWLGDTIAAIANEKAGIIVEGKPVLSSAQLPDAVRVLKEVANERRAELSFITEPLIGYPINLAGPHQRHNAALAVEALNSAGYHLSYDIVKAGLEYVTHPGRFERFYDKDGNLQFVLDGAHNPHAAKSLVSAWLDVYPNKKPSLVFGAVQAKDVVTSLKLLAPIATDIHLVPIDSPRSLSKEELEEARAKAEINATLHNSLDEGLAACQESITLVSGSLFLVGQMRAKLLDVNFQRSTQ